MGGLFNSRDARTPGYVCVYIRGTLSLNVLFIVGNIIVSKHNVIVIIFSRYILLEIQVDTSTAFSIDPVYICHACEMSCDTLQQLYLETSQQFYSYY